MPIEVLTDFWDNLANGHVGDKTNVNFSCDLVRENSLCPGINISTPDPIYIERGRV